MHYRANVQIWQLLVSTSFNELTNAVAKVAMGEKLSPRENFALNLAGTPRSLMKSETDFVEYIKLNMGNPNFKYETPGKFFASVRMLAI